MYAHLLFLSTSILVSLFCLSLLLRVLFGASLASWRLGVVFVIFISVIGLNKFSFFFFFFFFFF